MAFCVPTSTQLLVPMRQDEDRLAGFDDVGYIWVAGTLCAPLRCTGTFHSVTDVMGFEFGDVVGVVNKFCQFLWVLPVDLLGSGGPNA